MKKKSLLIALALITMGRFPAHAQVATITCPVPLSLNPANTKLLVGQTVGAFSAPDAFGRCFSEMRICNSNGVLGGTLTQTRSTSCLTTPLLSTVPVSLAVPASAYAAYGQAGLPGMIVGYVEPIPLTYWQNMLSGISANIANLQNQSVPSNVAAADRIISVKAALQKNYDALKLKIASMRVFGFRSMYGSAAEAPALPPGAPLPTAIAPKVGNKLFILKAVVTPPLGTVPTVPTIDPPDAGDLCVTNGYSNSLATLPTQQLNVQPYNSSALCVSVLTMALTNRPLGVSFPPQVPQFAVTASSLNTEILSACNAIPSGAIITVNCL